MTPAELSRWAAETVMGEKPWGILSLWCARIVCEACFDHLDGCCAETGNFGVPIAFWECE